jgi:hypothetical protein
MRGTTWERVGGWAGVAWFIVVIASLSVTPETPDADDPTAEIVAELADDRTGFLLDAYLLGLGALLFLVFTAALWSRLRAAEPGRGASVLVALGGLGSSIVVITASVVLLALVEAADEDREPEAVRALLELDETVTLGLGWTSAAFYAGAALSGLTSGALPRALGWVAAALAALFPITFLGVFSEADDGGVLGGIFFLGLLVNFAWILAASLVMLRAREAAPVDEPLGPPD